MDSFDIKIYEDLTDDEKKVISQDNFQNIIANNKIKFRRKANLEILNNLRKIIGNYPELRFHQILYCFGIEEIESDKFSEESTETLEKLEYEMSKGNPKYSIKDYEF
jgi:hypothetical protein